MKKKAEGGKIEGVKVPGADIMKEAESKDDGFKKGGKAGMKAEGGRAKHRMDKMPRKASGGAVGKFARGGSPYSAASKGGKDAPSDGSECA